MKDRRLAWLILIIAAGSLATGSGVRSMLGVMMPLIESDLGYSRASLSAVASISFFAYAFTQPLSGWATLRFGPKRVLLTGIALILLSGVGMIWATSLLSLHAFLGVIPMLGFSAGGLLPGTVLAARWFPHRQGLATGFVVGALPGGQALFAGLASIVLLVLPWREAYVLLALGFSMALLLLVLFVVRDSPDESRRAASSARRPVPSLVRTADFWLLATGYAACGITDQIMVVHMVPFLSDEGYSVTEGSMMFAVLSLAGLIGSILVGPVVDIFQSRYVIAFVYLLRALSYPFLFLFASTGSPALIFVFAIVFGVTYMANMPASAVLLRTVYGPETIAPTTGWLSMIHHLGGTAGVFMAGVFYEFTGNYAVTFIISLATLLVAVVASLLLSSNRPAPKEMAEAAG